MIVSIEANFFRKHEHLVLSLTSGLNVLRGGNEQGKSTCVEAIAYALFGSKALRSPLAECVTWGHPEKALNVKLVIRIGGALYEFTRSKAGAECNYEGGKVTGQAEVSAYAAELLGADAKVANLLMLAGQGDMRGVLSGGPAAVSALMSKLADFDLIDRILEAAQNQLTLGGEAPVQAKLVQAQETLDQAFANAPDEVGIAAAGAAVAVAAGVMQELEAASVEKLQPALLLATDELAEARRHNEERGRAVDARASAKALHDAEIMAHASALLLAENKPDAERMAELRRQLQSVAEHQRKVDAHKKFLALPAYPVVFWEGDRASFDAELADAEQKLATLVGAGLRINSEIEACVRQRITGGKCPTCGHAAHSDEHVAEHNRGLETLVAHMEETRKSNKAQQQEASETVAALKAVAKDSERRYPAVAALTEFVDVDVSVFPARPSWVGPVPSPIASTAQSELTTLEAQERAAAQAEGRVTVHAAAIVKHRALVETCDSTLERLPLIDTAPFVGKYDAAGFAFNEHNAKLSTARMALMEAQSQKQQLDQLAANSAASIAAARARIVEYNADLKTLAFNNTLVRKLKALKPLITDHLWSIVLGAVSSFFSTLRGEQSVVTKDKDGFKVNDKGIDSLSGSTLDVLALAIRCALTKTFVPHASFIILDEPFAACDLSRTGDGLGFLSTIGFNQALLCSHDELSEAVAENVISLGD